MALVMPFQPIVLTDKQRQRAERYLARSRRVGECLIWGGRKAGKGYGAFDIWLSHEPRRRRTYMAHRLVFTLRGDPLGPYEVSRHTCDNPPCVAEEHLIRGTQAENMADMDARGRRVNTCKLAPADIPVILLRRELGDTLAAIGADYGVCYQTIQLICRGINWKKESGGK